MTATAVKPFYVSYQETLVLKWNSKFFLKCQTPDLKVIVRNVCCIPRRWPTIDPRLCFWKLYRVPHDYSRVEPGVFSSGERVPYLFVVAAVVRKKWLRMVTQTLDCTARTKLCTRFLQPDMRRAHWASCCRVHSQLWRCRMPQKRRMRGRPWWSQK